MGRSRHEVAGNQAANKSLERSTYKCPVFLTGPTQTNSQPSIHPFPPSSRRVAFVIQSPCSTLGNSWERHNQGKQEDRDKFYQSHNVHTSQRKSSRRVGR